jgi:hypothetical protein
MEWWAEPEVPQTTILYFAFTITITEPCDPNSMVLGSATHTGTTYTYSSE